MQNPHQIARDSKDSYMHQFGELYEHSPWIVEQCADKVATDSLYKDISHFHQLLANTLLQADKNKQMKLILAHPRLAGKKAQQGELTQFSHIEQKSAGLLQCTEAEILHLNELNERYFQLYGFNFIMAVKNRSKQEIFTAFEDRLNNTTQEEIQNALVQINQIAWLRLEALFL